MYIIAFTKDFVDILYFCKTKYMIKGNIPPIEDITIKLLHGICPQRINTHTIENTNIKRIFETIDEILFPLMFFNILLKYNISREVKKSIAIPP